MNALELFNQELEYKSKVFSARFRAPKHPVLFVNSQIASTLAMMMMMVFLLCTIVNSLACAFESVSFYRLENRQTSKTNSSFM